MSISFWQILLVAVLFILLFGRGKVPQLMSDVAQGIKNFKSGMRDESDTEKQTTSAEKSVEENTAAATPITTPSATMAKADRV